MQTDSSSSLIPVHADYRVEHGHIVARGGADDVPYDGYGHTEIAGDFAKIHGGDNEGTVEFAESWGLLGWSTVTDRPPDSPEPLWWGWAHAANARLILDLYHYLHTDDEDGLEKYLDGFRVVGSSPNSDVFAIPAVVGYEVAIITLAGTAKEVARRAINQVINRNVSELPTPLAPIEFDDADEPPPPCLLSVIYHHLARTVRGGEVRRCQECGSVMIVEDKRRTFCPPPPPWAGRDESRCAVRARQRRQRQRKGSEPS